MYNAHSSPRCNSAPRLKLVEFIEPGTAEPRVCGALWQHGVEVHLLAPTPRPDNASSLLGGVLCWLEAACFAASDPRQVSRTCDANPEWHLRFSPFVVESNPHVMALRDQLMLPPDDERLRIVPAYGARFMRDGAETFDVLLLDGRDAFGLPRALSTQAFFDHCARRLGTDGGLVMNLHAQEAHEARILERIRGSICGAVLPVHDSKGSNCIAFACRGAALRALLVGPLQRPPGVDAEAWSSLQVDLAHVLGAWREEFA